ncbi:MAG: RNA polymerase sigma factor [Microthrixaceae bacterium]
MSPVRVVGDDIGSMEVDERSDEAVYAAHAQELVRFATGLVGVDDAPDIVTDAFISVARSDVWSEARDRRSLWFRAVVFESKSFIRSVGRRRARERKVALSEGVHLVERHERSDEIALALGQLSVQQRAVVMLTYWLDLTPSAVAELLDVSEGSVRKQLARARAGMKEALR